MNGGSNSSITEDDDEFVHIRGDAALSYNIDAVRGVAEAVRTTLGPAGGDKMLVSPLGDVTVTNDGVTVLREMDIAHPSARTMVEAAMTQEEEVGDGTTSMVLIAGELLRVAEYLLKQDLHPTVIVDGFNRGLELVTDDLDDLAVEVKPEDQVLRHIAMTSMAGKSVEPHAEYLVSLVLDAARSVTVDSRVDLEYLDIQTTIGGAITDSELRDGVVIDEEPCNESMPTAPGDTSILMLHRGIEVEEPALDAQASITEDGQHEQFVDREVAWIESVVRHVVDIGADVIFSREHIDDRVARLLAAEGVLAIEHFERSDTDFTFLRETVDANILSDPLAAASDDLGHATITHDDLFFVENIETHGATVLIRGKTEHVVTEMERSIRDALDVVAQTIADGRVIAGGGATEIELAIRLRDHATGVSGQKQLAIEAFADALEAIPQTLATNTGIDPIDALVDLRAAHATDGRHHGLNVKMNAVEDTFDAGIITPSYVTEQVLYNATKVVTFILKVDEVISASDLSTGDAIGEVSEPD